MIFDLFSDTSPFNLYNKSFIMQNPHLILFVLEAFLSGTNFVR